jgi:hypothetical protein
MMFVERLTDLLMRIDIPVRDGVGTQRGGERSTSGRERNHDGNNRDIEWTDSHSSSILEKVMRGATNSNVPI